MPIQRLFTKRDQRVFPNLTKEYAVSSSTTFLNQAQFYVNFNGPYQIHAEQYFEKLGLRRVIDIWFSDSGNGTMVLLDLSATLGDEVAAVGLIGAVLMLPIAVAVGAVSYLDYENNANDLIASYWSYLSSQTPSSPASAQTGTICGNCGLTLDPDSKFCKRCGAQVVGR